MCGSRTSYGDGLLRRLQESPGQDTPSEPTPGGTQPHLCPCAAHRARGGAIVLPPVTDSAPVLQVPRTNHPDLDRVPLIRAPSHSLRCPGFIQPFILYFIFEHCAGTVLGAGGTAANVKSRTPALRVFTSPMQGILPK